MIARALALLAILYGLGLAIYGVTLGRPARIDDGRTDAIVAITGGTGRIERAVELMKAGKARRLLIAGADPSVREADLIRRVPGSARIFACCVDLGSESVDTLTNAEEARRWLAQNRFTSVRLVTSDWHMRRAEYEFARALGSAVRLVPDAVRTEPRLMTIFKEYNKYLLRRGGILLGIRA